MWSGWGSLAMGGVVGSSVVGSWRKMNLRAFGEWR
jgi:hypothetical protein